VPAATPGVIETPHLSNFGGEVSRRDPRSLLNPQNFRLGEPPRIDGWLKLT